MDMYSNASAWMHQQPPSSSQLIHENQQLQSDGLSHSDAWKDRSGAASSSQQTLDLSDFDLGIPGEHISSNATQHRPATCSDESRDVSDKASEEADTLPLAPSTSTSPPPQSFYAHNTFQQQPYFLHNGPSSYSFNAGSWPNQPTSVPLSNYSSLNGATTSNPGPSQHHQPPTPPPQMMIE